LRSGATHGRKSTWLKVVAAAVEVKVVVAVAKGEAVAPGKVEVAPLAVEARVVAVAKATVRRVVGQAQLAIFLAVAEAMRLRPKRSFV